MLPHGREPSSAYLTLPALFQAVTVTSHTRDKGRHPFLTTTCFPPLEKLLEVQERMDGTLAQNPEKSYPHGVVLGASQS